MADVKHTQGPRYKVEHCDTRGVWVPVHRGTLRSHQAAIAKKQAFCRVMVDWVGNGVWEEIESLPYGVAASAQWDSQKLAAITKPTIGGAARATEGSV